MCVGRRSFIANHKINGEVLHPPVFVSKEYLTNDHKIVSFINTDQYDRQIAGDLVGLEHPRNSAAPFE